MDLLYLLLQLPLADAPRQLAGQRLDDAVQPELSQPDNDELPFFGSGDIFASSEESVGEGERQRCLSMRNLRNFLQVESNDLC